MPLISSRTVPTRPRRIGVHSPEASVGAVPLDIGPVPSKDPGDPGAAPPLEVLPSGSPILAFSACCGASPAGRHTVACDIVTGGGSVEERVEWLRAVNEKNRAMTEAVIKGLEDQTQ